MMTIENDRLVEEYLGAVARLTADLPADRRNDLLADLREHITASRAELDAETEPEVRAILHRLGDPAGIAAEARLSVTPPPVPRYGPLAPRYVPPPPVPAPRAGATTSTAVIVVAAVLAVVVLVVCLGVGVFLVAATGRPAQPDPPAGVSSPG